MNELATTPEPSVALMLQGALANIQAGQITPVHVEVLERMMGLYERNQKWDAEKQFAACFVDLQREMPVIIASSVIPNRGKYERFEDVMNVVGPLLIRHGFAVSFANEYHENRVTETCRLSHIGGHSQSNSFTVRVGGKADSETQADCKAATTAKRNALLNALNIVIRQDVLQNEEGDAMIEGSRITQAQADELRDWAAELKVDAAKFLVFAGAKSFEEISSSRLPELHEVLRNRQQEKGKA